MSLTSALDVEEVHVVSGGVNHSPEGHRVRDLTVEPDVLIGREQPCELGADDADDVPQHRDEDEATIERQDEAGTSGYPDRPSERVQRGKFRVGCLG